MACTHAWSIRRPLDRFSCIAAGRKAFRLQLYSQRVFSVISKSLTRFDALYSSTPLVCLSRGMVRFARLCNFIERFMEPVASPRDRALAPKFFGHSTRIFKTSGKNCRRRLLVVIPPSMPMASRQNAMARVDAVPLSMATNRGFIFVSSVSYRYHVVRSH